LIGWFKVADVLRRRVMEMTREELVGYIKSAIPFLEEAWTACFDGKIEKLLCAEQRGMRMLLAQFRLIAQGERVIPPDMITLEEASKRVEDAIAWAHRLLGNPNDMKPELKRWVLAGDTCADGLLRADARVRELELLLDKD